MNRTESSAIRKDSMLLFWLQGFYSDLTLLLIWNTFNTQIYNIYVELQLTEGYLPKWNITCNVSSVHPLKETPTGILRIWILSMCGFPWMLSFICQRRSGREHRVKGLRLGGRFKFCCSVLFYDFKGAEWVCWDGFFSFSGQLWRWGPLSPQGHNS